MANNIELTNFIKKNITIEDGDLKTVLSYFKTIKKIKMRFYLLLEKLVKLAIL